MISIKRAEKADAAEITKIKIAAFNKEINTYLGRDGGPSGYNKVESELGIIENHLAYKILLDERIIGGFFLYYEGGDILHFEDFVINPEYQGNGYGKELVSFAENKISEKYNEIILHASLPAKAIYLKKGYKEIGFHSIKTENGKKNFLTNDKNIMFSFSIE